MKKTEYYPGIKRYITSRVSNHNDVEDLTQSVFLEFYKNTKQNEIQNPEAYLFGIARTIIARHYLDKRNQPQEISIAVMEEDCSVRNERDHADQLKMKKLKETLKKSLEQLPPMEYETIRLCLSSEKLSVKETAQKVGIPISVFYKRYQRALRILRKISLDILKNDSDSL